MSALSESIDADNIEQEIPIRVTRSDNEAYLNIVHRLNRLSIKKRHDAYLDVDWEGADFQILEDDSRWVLGPDIGLAHTDWYQSLPPQDKAKIGLYWIASKMKVGLIFENVLKRGLLNFAMTLPNGTPEFRYAYHEVIEEAQHSLMFQEFVNRSGFDVPGLSRTDELASRAIVSMARYFPELFFIFVLGGEDPIDYVQRKILRNRSSDIHPLLERIMRIHVTEEARHLSFARQYLIRRIPELSIWRRAVLAVAAPVTLGSMAQLMMKPSKDMIRRFSIPSDVVREAFGDNTEHRNDTLAALAKVRDLCVKVGIVTAGSEWIWRALKIWE
ncbi:MAG TPA: diiron oxygenase [Acidimicrobiales bacterium]|nr:diiron oxygenase [Acidimicrobiales bacterium]